MRKNRLNLTLLLALSFTAAPAADLVVPANALVTFQFRDLSGLLTLWNASGVKAEWEKSIAATILDRSRIALKIKDLGSDLESVLDRAPQLDLLAELGCGETIFAVYDPGRREVLLAARVAPAGIELAKTVAAFPEKTHQGLVYRFKAARGEFGAGVAVSGDVLYVGTTERVLKAVAETLAKGGGWAPPPFLASRAADLKLDVDLANCRMSPYYRKYWIFGETGELAGKARLLLALRHDNPGWTEERLFLDPRADASLNPALPAAFSVPGGAAPFWMIRKDPGLNDLVSLWAGGILKIPAARRKDLTAAARYEGAAFGTARSEESDFDLSVDRPADPAAAGLPPGYRAPLDDLKDLLKRSDVTAVRWAWDLPKDTAAVPWHRQEGALALTLKAPPGDALAAFRKVLTRTLAAGYLCNAADVAWAPGDRKDTLRCTWPRPLLLSMPKAGVIAAATSPALLAKVEALLAAAPDTDLSAGLRFTEAGEKYVDYLTTVGLDPLTQPESGYRLMEDVIPSVREAAAGLEEIRKDRKAVPGGVVEVLRLGVR
ncbi:MAG: hypothetical protein KA419_17705 [Acidobacteria bacterium]|nr:hypothetical protein [Acidobacteriota bacterium]